MFLVNINFNQIFHLKHKTIGVYDNITIFLKSLFKHKTSVNSNKIHWFQNIFFYLYAYN